ncbi:MAG: helix-turn-helix transcriptional regulator [Erysipelotrichaceae bacterium]|nr:helix-turn-helix transcriptional regulator [Erysipelotrichaceae bacterium]
MRSRAVSNQANISKIENGAYNPSLAITNRLADAMDMDLRLQLTPRENQSF